MLHQKTLPGRTQRSLPECPSWHHCHLTEARFSFADELLLCCSILCIICFQRFPEALLCGELNSTSWDGKKAAYASSSSADAVAHTAEGDHDQAEQLLQLRQTQPRTTLFISPLQNKEEIVQGQVYTTHMTGALSSTALLCASFKLLHIHNNPCHSSRKRGMPLQMRDTFHCLPNLTCTGGLHQPLFFH